MSSSAVGEVAIGVGSRRGVRTADGIAQGVAWLAAVGLGGLGAFPIARYLWVVAHRIRFPFELEWMEGGSVEVVRRLAEGHNIYGPPSFTFTPWPYTPLYFWISAGVSKVTGVGFFPLRLVSVCASVSVLCMLYRIVVVETGDLVSGIVAAGIYAATYSLSGSWSDIGRVDSLFLAFALGAVALGRRATSPRAGALVGAVFFLSFFTKQDALLIAAPILLWLSITRWRAGLSALATLAVLVASSTFVMDELSHGWYGYYVFGELASQGIVPENWADFWRYDIFRPLAPLVLATTLGLFVLLVSRRGRVDWSRAGYWAASIGGLLLAGWVGRLHLGGYNDVLMPAYAGLAMACGLCAGSLRRHPRLIARVAITAVCLLVLWVQLGRNSYPVGKQIPSSLDASDGRSFLALVRRLPGEVVVLDHPYYATVVGKGVFADGGAIDDVLRSGTSRARRDLVSEMRTALVDPRIGAVILDDTGDEQNLEGELSSHYHLLRAAAVPGRRGFFPVTDLPLRPTLVYVRNGLPA